MSSYIIVLHLGQLILTTGVRSLDLMMSLFHHSILVFMRNVLAVLLNLASVIWHVLLARFELETINFHHAFCFYLLFESGFIEIIVLDISRHFFVQKQLSTENKNSTVLNHAYLEFIQGKGIIKYDTMSTFTDNQLWCIMECTYYRLQPWKMFRIRLMYQNKMALRKYILTSAQSQQPSEFCQNESWHLAIKGNVTLPAGFIKC